MTSSSTSRDRPVGGPDDFSSTRGREPAIAPTPDIRSTGRGGAGNIGSPSRDRDVRTASEQEFIRAHDARELEAVHSTGRGGIGNISGSHSRERGGAPLSPTRGGNGDQGQGQGQVHSSGRGGAGNIVPGPAPPYERGRSGAAGVEGMCVSCLVLVHSHAFSLTRGQTLHGPRRPREPHLRALAPARHGAAPPRGVRVLWAGRGGEYLGIAGAGCGLTRTCF
jgi:hypothetical protein